MSNLQQNGEPVKTHVTIRRHPKAGVWQGLVVSSRGTQMVPVSTRRNDRASVEQAARMYAERYHLPYQAPEPPQPVMQVVCGWCGKHLGTKPCAPEQAGQVTHGICDDCAKKFYDELKADGAPDDFAEGVADVALGGVRYAQGTLYVEEGVREYTDWRG